MTFGVLVKGFFLPSSPIAYVIHFRGFTTVWEHTVYTYVSVTFYITGNVSPGRNQQLESFLTKWHTPK